MPECSLSARRSGAADSCLSSQSRTFASLASPAGSRSRVRSCPPVSNLTHQEKS
ncbi:MAG: hypothetical protein LBI31_04975 [Zoogloeaceae bacterium]|nr:hypothetical protein [Zoogloeaceae bacterium]